jgi:hypothetical protein
MVSIAREKGAAYKIKFSTAPLGEVAVHAKAKPREMIAKNGMYVTDKFVKYAAPLVGPLPEYVSLDFSKK